MVKKIEFFSSYVLITFFWLRTNEFFFTFESITANLKFYNMLFMYNYDSTNKLSVIPVPLGSSQSPSSSLSAEPSSPLPSYCPPQLGNPPIAQAPPASRGRMVTNETD